MAMNPQRNSPAKPDSNKLLWAGVAIVLIIVLAMGVTLMRLQAQPQEQRLAVLPAPEAPMTNIAQPVASASTEAASAAAPLPPASIATVPSLDAPKPRIVHPRTSEPAVARAPEREAPKPDAAENKTPPDAQR